MPKMAEIVSLIYKARQGIAFRGQSNNHIIEMAKKMVKSSRHEKVIILLDILAKLARMKYEILSSQGFIDSFEGITKSRMTPVYDYVMNNFKEEIKLEALVEIANMDPSSFSRYFSNFNKKTFTQFVNEIRNGFACKMLIENKCNISNECFDPDPGFNNISNLNRVFKDIKKMCPSEYIKLHSMK